MTQIATVEKILPGGMAEISVPRKSACGHDCEECAGCGMTGAAIRARARNDVGAQKGDKVVVESSTKKLLGVVALVYLLPVVGFLPPMPDAAIESRHLGLKTAGEIADLQQKIQILTAAAQKNIDWPRLLALFDRPAPMAPAVQAAAPTVRIAVAQDEAFCFTYAETLESLQAAGAELCYFSPLRDAALPQHIGGLYLPGGYPELYAAQLAANTAMRCAINTAVQRGLPTVAECGGFLYLGQTLEDDAGTAHPMAGVLPGQGFRVGQLVRFGYAALTPQADSMLFRAGEPVPVHEFHHWDSTCNGTAFAAQKANGRHWDCGFANGHLYAGFPHLYWAGTPLPQRFVTAAAQYAQTKTGRTV